MPNESIEIQTVRRGIEAFNARDIDRLIEFFEPDVQLHSAFVAAMTGTALYEGYEGMRKWHEDLVETWSEIRLDVEGITHRGDHLLAVYRMRGRGLQSEVDVEMPVAHLMEFRRGRIWRLKTFSDPGEAAEEFESSTEAAP